MAVTFTAAAEPAFARVALEVFGADESGVTIERVDDSSGREVTVPVRGANPAPTFGGFFLGYDYEAPLNRPVKYRATARAQTPVTLANPSFETDLAGWDLIGCTLTRVTDQAHAGTGSAFMVPDGTTVNPRIYTNTSGSGSIAPSVEVQIRVWVYTDDNDCTARVVARWRGSGGAILSEMVNGPIINVPPGEWTPLQVTAEAPVGDVTYVAPLIEQLGTPPASREMWIDNVTIMSNELIGTALDVPPVVLAVSQAWLKHPGLPHLNRPVRFTREPELKSTVRRGVLPVLGRKNPIITTGVRSGVEATVELYAATRDDDADLNRLLDYGAPLFLQSPRGRFGEKFIAIADITETPIAGLHDSAETAYTLEVTEVDPPVGGIEGDPNLTYLVILNENDTYQTVLTNFNTYLDVLRNTPSV